VIFSGISINENMLFFSCLVEITITFTKTLYYDVFAIFNIYLYFQALLKIMRNCVSLQIFIFFEENGTSQISLFHLNLPFWSWIAWIFNTVTPATIELFRFQTMTKINLTL